MRSRAPGELAGAGSTVRKEMTSHWWEFFFGGKLCGSPLGESSGTPKRHSGWTAPPHDSCPETQDPPPGDCVGLFFRLIDVFVFGRLGSSLLCTGFLQLNGGYSSLKSAGFSSRGVSVQGSGTRASAAAALRLSDCGSRAPEHSAFGTLAGPGLEPMSPILAG